MLNKWILFLSIFPEWISPQNWLFINEKEIKTNLLDKNLNGTISFKPQPDADNKTLKFSQESDQQKYVYRNIENLLSTIINEKSALLPNNNFARLVIPWFVDNVSNSVIAGDYVDTVNYGGIDFFYAKKNNTVFFIFENPSIDFIVNFDSANKQKLKASLLVATMSWDDFTDDAKNEFNNNNFAYDFIKNTGQDAISKKQVYKNIDSKNYFDSLYLLASPSDNFVLSENKLINSYLLFKSYSNKSNIKNEDIFNNKLILSIPNPAIAVDSIYYENHYYWEKNKILFLSVYYQGSLSNYDPKKQIFDFSNLSINYWVSDMTFSLKDNYLNYYFNNYYSQQNIQKYVLNNFVNNNFPLLPFFITVALINISVVGLTFIFIKMQKKNK